MSSIITQALGDFVEDYATLNFAFLTLNLTTGVPTTLLNTPVMSVYKGSNTTQSVAGITLNVDYDSVTGLNHVLIDLSADAFYAVANDYFVVITTGQVNSVEVVGTVVANFSIENRSQQATNDAILVDTASVVVSTITNAAGTDIAADLIAVKAQTVAIETDTGEIGTAGAGLTDVGDFATAAKASIKSEVEAVMLTDTIAELAQGAPAIVASFATMIKTIYKFTINKKTQSSTTTEVFNSDESTVDHKSTTSESAGTATSGEFKTGP